MLTSFTHHTVSLLRYAPFLKTGNPAVIIISNWSLERVYHKALDKDPTALDSLLTRLEIVEVTDILDIEGFKEALAPASAATTVTPTTSPTAEDLSVTMSPREEELVASNSTIDLLPPNSPLMESSTSTPPLARHSAQPSTTTSQRYQILEEDLIPCAEQEVTREETVYEKFTRERREKRRKQQQEEDKLSAIDKIAIKGKTILFTGYN